MQRAELVHVWHRGHLAGYDRWLVAVEKLDEFAMSNVADLTENNGRREPKCNRKTVIEFVSEIMSIKLLCSIRLVTGFIFKMVRDRPEGRS